MDYVYTFLAGVVLGAVVGYLALRNNPKYKAYLDSISDKFDR